MKKIIAIVCLTLCLTLCLCACGPSTISAEKAEKIVLKDLGVSEKEVESIDLHVGQYDGKPCYSVYVTIDGEHLVYMIDCSDGTILSIEENDHGHSH